MPFRVVLTIFSLMMLTFARSDAQNHVRIQKVVIDPGHGGHDPGTVSANRRVLEKNITLSVALKLGTLIKNEFPDIDIIYTRKTDRFIPLNERSEIANKNKANLFISIHVNGVKARSASGSETFVMGPDHSSSNLEVSKLENSVITLEGDDYESKYEGFDPNNPESYIIFSLLQNAHLEQSLSFASLVQNHSKGGPIKVNRGIKQAGFLVLWKTTMPSVLVELGFISNPEDLTFLASEKTHEKFARNIFNAFKEYRALYEGANTISSKRETSPTQIQEKADTGGNVVQAPYITYRVQIMAVDRILKPEAPDFKGEKDVSYTKSGKYYKYTVGNYYSPENAEKELTRLEKKFKGAFIVKIENGVSSPYKRK